MLWAGAALPLALVFAAALSLFTSVWGETTRDMRFGLGQLFSVWYLLTPVLYPLTEVPEAYRGWMLLNPLAILAETFKWGLFGVGEFAAGTPGRRRRAGADGRGLAYFMRAEARAIDQR